MWGVDRARWSEGDSQWPRQCRGFDPSLCLSLDIVRYRVFLPRVPVCRIFSSSLRGVAFPRGYLRYNCFDANGLVGDWVEFFITASAVVLVRFSGDVLGRVGGFACRFSCRGGDWEVCPVLAWDVCSCDGESRGLDLIVQFRKRYRVLPGFCSMRYFRQ